MFKQFIAAMPGADMYMVGSFLTFFFFFLLAGLYLGIANKQHLHEMSQMPLNDATTPTQPNPRQ